jgi:cytochrome c5
MGSTRRHRALALLACLATAPAQADEGAPPPSRAAEVFQLVCAQCHARAGLDVPQIGDAAAWQERAARGAEALLASTVEGRGGMPPLGSCSFCTEQELRELIALLAGAAAP